MRSIKITEVGRSPDHYYTMIGSFSEKHPENAELRISGLSGWFKLTKAQRIKLAKFLLINTGHRIRYPRRRSK